ncbi:nitrous oxide reductase family maturation protein NosD [Nonomuraea sp. NEAU-A123]|uniref:right-handed parallel beta-helix repeat-containing protein n=1 Tax=Nonomuraea sp. NEAU-A123 TaxID=2839649 RepID=UPI001BE40907|nr:right-handed parallel beta-helix repeat-containing protein [Nonomuraea sp. NEAU-A123]MBT2230355.1 right-handed parallel beta-helix repeat-containing protein [Nonomuraea sp. NEAU-A123]
MSQVRPGQSIQRALDEAGAGATIELAAGTYAENVWIRHSGVTLTGAGAGRTVLVPGDSVPEGIPPLHDAAADVVSGITAHGVGDVTIAGLTVRGASGAGIYAHTVTGLTVRDVEAAGNAVWGVYVRESSRCEVTGCTASGSQYGGIALSFCPETDGLVADNETFANAFGIFIDNSSRVRVLRNSCHGNAAGLLMLNQTYEGEPDGGVRDCLVSGNDLYGNGLAAGGDAPDALGAAGPPISGVGLALIGTHRVSVVDNRIHDNHPSGETVMGAAFVMGSSKGWGGDDAVDNHILWNLVTGNSPLDHQLGVDLERQVCAGNTADKGEPEGWGR